MAKGEWIAFLDHDDQLAPFALFEIVKLINQHPDVDVIYTDEDKIRLSNQHRFSPFFKPDFNLDYLRSLNYMTHFLVVRKSLGDSMGWLDSAYDGSQDYDCVLKLIERTKNIYHIPKILYHWKATEGSVARSSTNKTYAVNAGERALAAHLKRYEVSGTVESGKYPYEPRYRIANEPKISMIIPNRDNSTTLKCFLDSVFQKTTYRNYEVIIVENGSEEKETFTYYRSLAEHPNIKIVDWKEDFNFSKVINFGEEHATGEVILLLNNDLEVITENWLERMLEHCLRPEIGAVGAKLIYPNNTIQHAGVIVGMFGAAGHSHKFYDRYSPGYYNRLICNQNYSALTAACLMMRREVFKQVGGLDPAFKIEFGDVDFCLRILQLGYRNLWTPYAQLYHHESLTRGANDTKEKRQLNAYEVSIFKTRWSDFLKKGDPTYNPNLTLEMENFDYG
jgi:GT2 family glycosyltransferase